MRTGILSLLVVAGMLGPISLSAAEPAVGGSPDAEQTQRLFDGAAAPLAVTLTGPWLALARDKTADPDPREATLTLADGASFALAVQPRGKSRRKSENCQFPPIRLDFKRSEVAGSLFAGQNKLKLVTHCGRLGTSKTKYSDQLHSEYLLYRVLNLLTDKSYRVRMLDITWVDTTRNKRVRHPGFLIEHKNGLAGRLGMTPVSRPGIPLAQLDANYSALVALFAYFAGNTDFSFRRGPSGEDCCHNALPVRYPNETTTFAIPYDFDATGFVNPGYAQPVAGTGLTSVLKRLHRGYCAHASKVPGAIDVMGSARAEISRLLTSYPAITDKRRKVLLRYTDRFYQVLDDPRKVQQQLVSRCR